MIRGLDQAGNISPHGQVEMFRAFAYKKGDINGDRTVDLTDALLALKIINGLDAIGILADYAESGADVNGDGRIGVEEVIYALQAVAEPSE
jgi:hypothetical protein